MTDIEVIMIRALERIAAHPYYQVPSEDNPKYHSSVCRLNACIDTAMKAIEDVRDIKQKESAS